MAKASDNAYPSLLVVETAAPASPAAGKQRLFIDPADHVLKRKDSAGTVTSVEAAGGGSSSLTFKRTKLVGGGNKSLAGTTTTWGALDATNLAYVTFTLAIGDVVALKLCFQAYNNTSTWPFSFDFDVDQPTSANVRADEACDSGCFIYSYNGDRRSATAEGFFTATEAGVHGFRPVWRGWGGGTLVVSNATSAADDTPILFFAQKLGAPS